MDLIEYSVEFGILVVLLTVGLLAGGFAERRHLRLLAAREVGNGDFLISQIKSFPGAAQGARAPTIVIGEAVIATDYFKTFIATLRKIFGGELRSYNSLLSRARREALQRLVEQARERGYNAICNVRFETADVGGSTMRRRAAMVAILASATAYHRAPLSP